MASKSKSKDVAYWRTRFNPAECWVAVFVFFVISLIVGAWGYVIYRSGGHYHEQRHWLVAGFAYVVGMTYYTFFATMLTDPGGMPDSLIVLDRPVLLQSSSSSATGKGGKQNKNKQQQNQNKSKNKNKTSLRSSDSSNEVRQRRRGAASGAGTRSQGNHSARGGDGGPYGKHGGEAEQDVCEYRGVVFREFKRNGCRRVCRKCRKFKADRCHHCYSCNRCVRKLDHHCVFVNNCVGHGNHKFFMLFLFYASSGAFYITASILACFSFPIASGRVASILAYRDTALTCVFASSFVLWLGLAMFGLFHLYLVLSGHTTIEYMEKRNTRVNGRPYVNLYAGTRLQNFQEVFGTNPLLWLLPTRRSVPGDGLNFNVLSQGRHG